ncbi:c-type cytochrome [Prosthecochloris sp. ZM_2]|uniref:c-type cytochrome n=1 Tax=Prosthecochloris sp. ZM_2 TaxID=2045206 RepID=UPI001F28E7B1|nr:c-type cytochrome [Prosthecochloris sp. ZM_2]
MHTPANKRAALAAGFCFMLFLSACSSPGDGKSDGAAASQDVAATGHDGKAIYERHCMMCHSMAPPPVAAPPVRGVSYHYREAFENREDAVAHMVGFMKNPDPERAVCDPEAIERFGLMPAMTLPDDELRAVSVWFWDQYDPAMREMHRKERARMQQEH